MLSKTSTIIAIAAALETLRNYSAGKLTGHVYRCVHRRMPCLPCLLFLISMQSTTLRLSFRGRPLPLLQGFRSQPSAFTYRSVKSKTKRVPVNVTKRSERVRKQRYSKGSGAGSCSGRTSGLPVVGVNFDLDESRSESLPPESGEQGVWNLWDPGRKSRESVKLVEKTQLWAWLLHLPVKLRLWQVVSIGNCKAEPPLVTLLVMSCTIQRQWVQLIGRVIEALLRLSCDSL